jgi:hypothetical protein
MKTETSAASAPACDTDSDAALPDPTYLTYPTDLTQLAHAAYRPCATRFGRYTCVA